MPDLVVLSSASGKQCAHIIPHLYNNPSYSLRLIVRSQKSADRLTQQYPDAEVLPLDLANPSDCTTLIQNATTILHINPSFHPHESEIGISVVNAAVTESKRPGNSFKHFVFSSVLHPEIRKMLNHDRKRYVEEYLGESGLNYTILQPAHFMDPYVGTMIAQKNSERAVFRAMWDPDIRFSFLSLADLGEASALVVRERERHFLATYPLCSTGPVSYSEVLKTVGGVVGKEFVVERVGPKQALEQICQMLFGTVEVEQKVKDAPERMLLYYDKRGLVGNVNVLEWLLGRKGMGHEECARRLVEGRKT